jgi:hypothetical protein
MRLGSPLKLAAWRKVQAMAARTWRTISVIVTAGQSA